MFLSLLLNMVNVASELQFLMYLFSMFRVFPMIGPWVFIVSFSISGYLQIVVH